MSERDALEAARDALDAAYARSGHPDDLAAKHLINIALAQHDQARPGVEPVAWRAIVQSVIDDSNKMTTDIRISGSARSRLAEALKLPTPIRGGREEIAREVYQAMRWSSGRDTPDWVEFGTSAAQEEARKHADRLLALPASTGTEAA